MVIRYLRRLFIMLNKTQREIVETGICFTIETDIKKKWSKTSVKRMIACLDLAKNFEIFLEWEDIRQELEEFLQSKK